jgi:hypothetical protein
MGFGQSEYGGVVFSAMSGNEPGYATKDGEVMLHSIRLTESAVKMLAAGKAVRILSDGAVEAIEGETAGLIVFGNYKGDRPRIGGK